MKKIVTLFILLTLISAGIYYQKYRTEEQKYISSGSGFNPDTIPEYQNDITIIINNDIPFFTDDELTGENYIRLSELDELGRSGSGILITDREHLIKDERSEIGYLKPSGWNQNKYPDIIKTEPAYLYHRSHILMYKMTGNDYNVIENLITGTEQFNRGMFDNEKEALDYLYHNSGHIIYRVTPYYDNENLIATGVLIESASVEDKGKGFHMCRWVYNIEDGIYIDYKTGKNNKK